MLLFLLLLFSLFLFQFFSFHTTRHKDWQIYIDQSKASLDRGGGATFDAFFSLCDNALDDDDDDEEEEEDIENDSNDNAVKIQVIPAILPKPASGGKGPWIRCVWNTNNKKNNIRPSPNLDVSNVDSVDKVYRVLTKHMGVKVRNYILQHNTHTHTTHIYIHSSGCPVQQ